MQKDQLTSSLISKTNATYKLLFSAALAIGLFFLLSVFNLHLLTRLMISWDFFNLTMIIICWIIFLTTTSKQLSSLAIRQDETLPAGFIIILISLFFSLFGTIFLLMYRNSGWIDKELHPFVSLAGVGLSWILLHTIFTLRYAHLYFIPDSNQQPLAGINFPDADNEPDYLDFAYFSFVIGMTFQVSDVTINSKRIRRFVLVHSLIAFVFNTLIVALTINAIATIKMQ